MGGYKTVVCRVALQFDLHSKLWEAVRRDRCPLVADEIACSVFLPIWGDTNELSVRVVGFRRKIALEVQEQFVQLLVIQELTWAACFAVGRV
jgi:hypothetical protein